MKKKIAKKKLYLGRGLRKRCDDCRLTWTANAGGRCTQCLDRGARKPVERNPGEMVLTRRGRLLGRRAEAIIRDAARERSLPAAVCRGIGLNRSIP